MEEIMKCPECDLPFKSKDDLLRHRINWHELRNGAAYTYWIAKLKDKDKYVRKSAAEALDGLGWRPDNGEAGAAYWAAKGQWDKCVDIGSPAIESLIVALDDLNFRWRAALALSKLKDAHAVRSLIDEYTDSFAYEYETELTMVPYDTPQFIYKEWKGGETEYTQIIVKAIIEIGLPAVEPLITILESVMRDTALCIAARVLGMLKDARAVEPLIVILNDKSQSRDVREAAIIALGQINDNRAIKPLTIALEDKNLSIRSIAEAVLNDLTPKN